ncbi:nucleotidyltransferase [candidate division KSB3 bacterium]|uniref:Nucleotidyltransferase n=1 Tax=candidate division KSB3 bacterium TaxID=2044937 RepID=A0A2G6KJ03_9BACT|nr:MAG: nucleotidyltransferase [candidate division KSB3 bacterium]
MKAMIFAAGLGTRLRPLTETLPKALIPIDGAPLLDIAIRRLQQCGVTDILVNVHHLADQIVEFLQKNRSSFEVDIHISDETEKLLDTGGALKKAAWFFDNDEPFFVYNVDILSDIDLQALYHSHCQQPDCVATLAVTARPSTRCLLFDESRALYGWENRSTQEQKLARSKPAKSLAFAFSGIHVINPAIFCMMPEHDVFSIIELYLQIAATERIMAFEHDYRVWLDVGKYENLPRAAEILRQIKGSVG